jgi:hypothetical protein
LDSTLEALIGGVDRDLAARYFESWVLRLAGLFPAPTSCPSCGAPLLEDGAILPRNGDAIVCFACGGRDGLVIEAATLALLRRFGRESLPVVAGAPPLVAALRQIEAVCAHVRRRFLQRELRSYDVIQQTLSRL